METPFLTKLNSRSHFVLVGIRWLITCGLFSVCVNSIREPTHVMRSCLVFVFGARYVPSSLFAHLLVTYKFTQQSLCTYTSGKMRKVIYAIGFRRGFEDL